jgi:hypothetical protein
MFDGSFLLCDEVESRFLAGYFGFVF